MPAVRYVLDPERSEVSVEGSSSIHPIHAKAAGLEGWVELNLIKTGVGATPAVSGEVRIAVDRLKSGNRLVDVETRRRIDAGRHPFIGGVVTGSVRIDEQTVGLEGDLTFRGETRPVRGRLTVTIDGDELRLEGQEQFDVRAWGLEPPKVGLLRVHPEITVHLAATARRA